MSRTGLVALLVMLVPRMALACPVCFGASDGPMLQGSNMGILALLVVTLTMLGGFAAFFWTLARRAARADAPDRQSPASAPRLDSLAGGGAR